MNISRLLRRAIITALTLPLLAVSLAATAGPVPEADAIRQGPASASPRQAPAPIPEQPIGPSVARVYYADRADLDRLAESLDIWEVDRAAGYVVVLLTPARETALRRAGYRVEIDQQQTAALTAVREAAPTQTSGIPGYPCYRTVEETYSQMVALASAYPALASWTDIGDSWDKIMPGGPAGYDLYELTLTNTAISGPKPHFFLMSAIHAREYVTAELAARYVEKLLADYGVDADATWLLNYYELRVVFQANPDGRKKAEAGTWWRKNTDTDDGCTAAQPEYDWTYGVDLNRNSTFKWGMGGSSPTPCEVTYRGPAAGSEPEVQVLEGAMRAIFADQRGPADTDAAPADTEGLMISLHSFSELVLFPWGWSWQQAPNYAQLQTLGRKFGFHNGYQVCAAGPCLYTVSGSTDDFSYGELGIAAYKFEIGTTFFQSFSTF